MNNDRYVLSKVFKSTTNELVTYYSDNTIEIEDICDDGTFKSKKIIDISTINNIDTNLLITNILKNDIESDLEQDRILRPLYLSCILQKNLTFITDIFNFKSSIIHDSNILSNAVYICENKLDYEIFSNLFNLKVIDNYQKISQNEFYIDINPIKQKSLTTIYTTVPIKRVSMTKYFTFKIYEIYVKPDTDKDIEISLEKILTNRNFEVVYRTNFELSANDTFKLLLMMLNRNSININMRLYLYIKNYLFRFREYRHISLSGINCGLENFQDKTITNNNGFIVYKNE